MSLRKAAFFVYFVLMAVPLRRGVKVVPIRNKELFSDGEVPSAIKLEGVGEGVKALMALPLKKKFKASLIHQNPTSLIKRFEREFFFNSFICS